MNIRNVPLLVAALLSPSVSSAVCPIEHSTVFYINGIGVDKDDTEKSRKRLEDVLSTDPRIRPDCVSVKPAYSYSANETIPYAGIALDLTEALIQKAAETGRSITDATRSLLRLDDAAWIDDVLEAAAILAGGTTYLIEEQINEHLAAYQTEAQTSGTLVLAGHSQGNYYANEEWNRLTPAAQSRVHLVAAATPATSVADDGPYTTLAQDNWAAGVFALFGAPFANVSNTEPCIGNFNDRWNCHGWKESYMNGTNSRNKIVNDIIAVLPAVPVVGAISAHVFVRETHLPLANTVIQLFSIENLSKPVDEKTTDTEGNVIFTNIIPGPRNGFRLCRAGTSRCGGFLGVVEGKTIDLTVFL